MLNIPRNLKLHTSQSTAELKSYSPALWPSHLGYITFYTNNELQFISLMASDCLQSNYFTVCSYNTVGYEGIYEVQNLAPLILNLCTR
jgi:hypothetical protein